MKSKGRLHLIGIILAVLLCGCGGGDSDHVTGSPKTQVTTSTEETVTQHSDETSQPVAVDELPTALGTLEVVGGDGNKRVSWEYDGETTEYIDETFVVGARALLETQGIEIPTKGYDTFRKYLPLTGRMEEKSPEFALIEDFGCYSAPLCTAINTWLRENLPDANLKAEETDIDGMTVAVDMGVPVLVWIKVNDMPYNYGGEFIPNFECCMLLGYDNNDITVYSFLRGREEKYDRVEYVGYFKDYPYSVRLATLDE